MYNKKHIKKYKMGWFNKKEAKTMKHDSMTLPSLPELPTLPSIEEDSSKNNEFIPQLPSFPNSSLGQKFSQDTIKQAVTGKKEGDGDLKADDYEEDEIHMMPKPPIKEANKYSSEKENPYKYKKKTIESEPLFIRIDKFEESMKTFQKAKEKMLDIDHMLKEIKKIKENEEMQLDSWEKELQIIKEQIEKIDKQLFSNI